MTQELLDSGGGVLHPDEMGPDFNPAPNYADMTRGQTMSAQLNQQYGKCQCQGFRQPAVLVVLITASFEYTRPDFLNIFF